MLKPHFLHGHCAILIISGVTVNTLKKCYFTWFLYNPYHFCWSLHFFTHPKGPKRMPRRGARCDEMYVQTYRRREVGGRGWSSMGVPQKIHGRFIGNP